MGVAREPTHHDLCNIPYNALQVMLSRAIRTARPRLARWLSSTATVPPQPPAQETHFGFTTVPFEKKQGMVNDVFTRVAEKYVVPCGVAGEQPRLDPPPGRQRAVFATASFATVMCRYDIMNDMMSGGLHRVWKDHFVGMVGPVLSPGPSTAVCRALPAG